MPESSATSPTAAAGVPLEITQGLQNKWAIISLRKEDRRRSRPGPDLRGPDHRRQMHPTLLAQNNVKAGQVSRSLRTTIVH
jgi:hypothetical protein